MLKEGERGSEEISSTAAAAAAPSAEEGVERSTRVCTSEHVSGYEGQESVDE